MGITKTDFFSEEQNDIATMFKAIGHPARVAILDYLLVNACITGDIVNELPLAQPNFSAFERTQKCSLSKEPLKVMLYVTVLTKKAWKSFKVILEIFFPRSIAVKVVVNKKLH
jgi:hypothetical protein